MTSVLLHTLNHYPEFHTNADINGIIAFVNSLPLPPAGRVFPLNIITHAQRARYTQKFGAHFVVVGAQLFYRPSPRINLEVVRPHNHIAVLNALWNNPRQGLGLGINSFYYQVCFALPGHYSRRNNAFLAKQRRLSNREKFQENCQ